MKIRAVLRAVGALVAAAMLAACGGGGGAGGGNQPPPPPANIAPTAAFTADPVSGQSPLTVDFDASSSDDPDGNIASYSWDFGDGSPLSSQVSPSHTYNAGSDGDFFTARLTVRDDDGAVGTKQAQIRVGPPGGNFTLSGSVLILPSSAVDSDVNDTFTTPVSNDDFDNAQSITNPVSLGGYLTQPGAGEPGNLETAGDVADFYRVSLAGNETILLTVGEPTPADPKDDPTLTLQIWDDSQRMVDAAVDVTNSASLPAPGAGDFFIEVGISAGATTYVLNLGQTLPTAADLGTQRLASDFVPGEVVVFGADGVTLPAEYRRVAGGGGIDLVSVRDVLSARMALGAITGPRVGGQIDGGMADKYETLAATARLAKLPGIHLAEPNYIRYPAAVPNDPFYRFQWHYANVNLPLAWDLLPANPPTVIVAVVDTGILPNHPDLAGQTVPGYDFVRNVAAAGDGNGIDSDPTDPGDPSATSGSTFHGSHVAGTVAARSDNGEGVAGVTWRTNTRIMPVRALGQEFGTNYDVMQAVRFAAGLANDSGTVPSQPADVINLSLGSSSSSAGEQQLATQVRNLGIVIVAAAGNESSSAPFYPASYDGVVSVSSTSITNALAPYSNFGAAVDVAAPGGDARFDRNGDGLADGVLSTAANDTGVPLVHNYTVLQGTSMAAPHMAGVVALMKSVYANLTPDTLDQVLIQGRITDDLGTPGRDDKFGHGLIDAQKAVITALELAAAGGTPTDPILTGSPNSVNFGVLDTTANVLLRNAGGGALTITNVSSTAPWLAITPVAVDADGLGTYELTVDRNVVDDGTHSAQARFESNAPSASTFVVSAVMQKFPINPIADAGRHYIIAYHPATGTTHSGTTATSANGLYNFTIPQVGFGTFQIYAGTDADNDHFICDGGEACGAYRLLEFPEQINVSGSAAGFDFVSGFPVNLFDLAAPAGSDASSAPQWQGIPIPPELQE